MIQKMTDPWELLQAHQFAIVDQLTLRPQSWHAALPLMPLEQEALKTYPEKLPALLPLEYGKPYMELLADNLEEARKESKPGLLRAMLALSEDVEPERLQRHLTDRLVAHLASSGRVYVRYFDPTVFPKLARIIPPNRWSLLYGPVARWSIPFQEEWISFPAPEVEHRAAAWVITDAQWERVERIRYINDALMEREVVLERPWESFEEYSKATEVAERAVVAAQKLYGIRERDELLMYTVKALIHGEHFHRHPVIQEALRHPLPEGVGVTLNTLNETIWAETVAYNND